MLNNNILYSTAVNEIAVFAYVFWLKLAMRNFHRSLHLWIQHLNSYDPSASQTSCMSALHLVFFFFSAGFIT